MNSYERYTNTIKSIPTDFLPRIPILMHWAADYSSLSYAEFARDYQALAKANFKLAEDFDIDTLDVMSDPWRETTAFGGQIEYLPNAIPKYTRHPLADSKDLKNLETASVENSERIVNSLKAIGLYKDRSFKQKSITGWVEGPAAEAATLRGVSNFLIDLIDDEAYGCQLMDICTDFAIKFAKAQVAAGCDTIGLGDAIASQVSEDIYSRLIWPREKKLVDAIHEAGGFVRLHICGNINHLLNFIKDLNIDILDCDWMVDMERARKFVANQTALVANLNPVEDVLRSSPKEICEKLMKIYKQVGNPLFAGAGCEIPLGTPVENLKALCTPVAFVK
jgi:MtaA/CmuA family methyltransferase